MLTPSFIGSFSQPLFKPSGSWPWPTPDRTICIWCVSHTKYGVVYFHTRRAHTKFSSGQSPRENLHCLPACLRWKTLRCVCVCLLVPLLGPFPLHHHPTCQSANVPVPAPSKVPGMSVALSLLTAKSDDTPNTEPDVSSPHCRILKESHLHPHVTVARPQNHFLTWRSR